MESEAPIAVRIGEMVSPSTYWAHPLFSPLDNQVAKVVAMEKVGA